MVLVLVLHTLDNVTATVPMCVILMHDLQKRRQIPEGFKLRQVVPTSGLTSTSVWDVTDVVFFSEWLGQNLGPGVTHTVVEVVEQFSLGLMGTVRQGRASDKAKNQLVAISATTKSAVSRAGETISDIDKKYDISERTSQTFKRMSDAATRTKERAMENPTIARVSTSVNAGVHSGLSNPKSMGMGIDWACSRLSATLTTPGATAPRPNPTEAPPPRPVASQPSTSQQAQQTPPPEQALGMEPLPVFDLTGDDEGQRR